MIEDYALEYPLDPHRLASTLGLRVHTFELGTELYAAVCPHVEAVTFATSVAGSVKYDVYLDPLSVGTRRRFSLMHEISHVWLGHLDSASVGDAEKLEGEANFLAQYLLAPDVLVDEWLPELTTQGVRQEFQVGWKTAELVVNRVSRARLSGRANHEYNLRILSNARRAIQSEVLVAGGAA